MESLDENLLASPAKRARSATPTKTTQAQAKEAQKEEEHARSSKKNLKLVAYCLLGFWCFLVFTLWKLPQNVLVGDFLATLSTQTPYYWHAERGSFRPLLRPHLHLEDVTVIPRFGDTTNAIVLPELNITPNLFRSFPWKGHVNPSSDFFLSAFGGQIYGSIGMGSSTSAGLQAEDINLEKVTLLKSMNLDLKGILSTIIVNAEMEQSHFSKANGDFSINAKNLILDPSNLGLNMPLPVINLGPLVAQGTIKAGKLHIDHFTLGDAKHDIEMQVDGGINLRDPYEYSEIDLKISVKFADKLLQSVPALNSMMPLIAAKRADGSFGMKLSGSIMNPGMPTPLQ